MNKTLRITLYSDLCVGVGKGFAYVVDTDTALDDYGVPYIPAKRIKGCMRDVAEYIGIDDNIVNEIFGTSGNETAGSLSISDAKITGYKDFVLGINPSPFVSARISEYFCSVRAETAIENDTAKKNSLRFTRVVNQIDPRNDKQLIFESDISFDEKYKEDIIKICKGLRNIGYHRNRGFGAVKCNLEDNNNKFELTPYNFEDDKEYEIKYTVYLESDLMLPASNANNSLDYIPGTSVLGAFAAKYIKSGNEFNNDFFLSNNVKFGNLYISDKDGNEYIPAPGFMGKYKAPNKEEFKGVKNFIAEKGKNEVPTKKPFKKGYLNIEKGYKQPKTKIVYHNNLADEDGGLYTQYCLCSDQYFSGSIIGKGEYISVIYGLLADGVVSFGRSKTAQYSKCNIVPTSVAVVELTNEGTVTLNKGKKAAYLCESGVVLCNDDGINDISVDTLCNVLNVNKDNVDSEFTRITSSVISGYNGKWNLKKPQFPVIGAGSVIVFTPDEDMEVNEIVYIGDKQNEGYGRTRLIPNAENYLCKNNCHSEIINNDNNSANKLLEKFNIENSIIKYAIKEAPELNLDNSQVGRVMLMCKESVSYIEFIARINSIKTDSTKLAALYCFDVKNKVWKDIKLDPKDSSDWSKIKKYILTLLTVKKYIGRGNK